MANPFRFVEITPLISWGIFDPLLLYPLFSDNSICFLIILNYFIKIHYFYLLYNAPNNEAILVPISLFPFFYHKTIKYIVLIVDTIYVIHNIIIINSLDK